MLLLFPFFNRKPDVEVLHSLSQKWSAGRKEAGMGINFKIKVVVNKSSKKLKFEGLMIDTMMCDLKIRNEGEQLEIFSKGDTLILQTSLKTERNYHTGVLRYNIRLRQKEMKIRFTEQKGLYYK